MGCPRNTRMTRKETGYEQAHLRGGNLQNPWGLFRRVSREGLWILGGGLSGVSFDRVCDAGNTGQDVGPIGADLQRPTLGETLRRGLYLFRKSLGGGEGYLRLGRRTLRANPKLPSRYRSQGRSCG